MNLEQLKEAVECVRKGHSLMVGYKNAPHILLDLAEKVIEIQGCMPEKTNKPTGDANTPYSYGVYRGYNEAIDLCVLALAGKE